MAQYDVLLYIANWPQKRAYPWKTLLAARSIENQCYTIGVNRTGKDGNGLAYSGDSAVYDFKGEMITEPSEKEKTIIAKLSHSSLVEFRESFPAGMDADSFSILM